MEERWGINAETFEKTGCAMNGVFAVSMPAVLEWPRATYQAVIDDIEASGVSGGSAFCAR